MSKRRNPNDYSSRAGEITTDPSDKILHRGDAVRMTWKGVTVKTKPKVSLIDKIKGKKTVTKPAKTILDNSKFCFSKEY